MATEASSLANLYQDQDDIAKCFGHIVYNIINNSIDFDVVDFEAHDLYLSESYCLLWQNAETGEVDGRKVGLPLKIGVLAALFIDLYASGLIKVFMHPEDDEPMFRLTETHSTETFLDFAIFDSLRVANAQGRLREAKLWKWLLRAEDADCVENTFDSLIARGILKEKSSGLLGLFKKFPTVNPEPERTLEKKIKDIAFNDLKPDSYMLSLLILSRESDRIFMCEDPILRKHFTSAEYKEAKKTLDKILLGRLSLY